ncbi:MAG: transcriptional regulator [Pseudomonadota bacterium]
MAIDDKKAFSERLKLALSRLPKSVKTAAELAHNFNLKHPNEPVTPQAATKWLNGTAVPTKDKIDTLAQWLHTDPHWLNYGSPSQRPRRSTGGKKASSPQIGPLSDKETRLLLKVRLLSEHQADLVCDLVNQLAMDREIWAEPAEK